MTDGQRLEYAEVLEEVISKPHWKSDLRSFVWGYIGGLTAGIVAGSQS